MSEITSGRESGRKRPRGYIDWNPHPKTLVVVEQVLDILEEYRAHLPLTVRQIFYRLVGAYGFEKTEGAYKKLCDYLVKARRAELIPFSALRDDGMTSRWVPWFDELEDFWDEIGRQARSFRLNRQEGQKVRIELWCEAAGMVPQLARVAGKYSVTAYSNGGFASLPAVREIVNRCCDSDVPTVLLHVGDFDPSGESIFEAMTEDVMAFLERDRTIGTQRLIPERIALTEAQVRLRNLPTAPPKKSDSRSARWKGETCQAEALAPDELAEIVEDAIRRHLDVDRVESQIKREHLVRTDLLRALPRGSE